MNDRRYLVEQRLLARRRINKETGCWEYTKGLTRCGYGRMGATGVLGKSTTVHRIAYVLWVGPIPEGLEVHHECKTRSCFNPEHSRAVTHAENVALGDYTSNHRNGRKTHCKRGHAFKGDNIIWERQARGGWARKCRACRDQREKVRTARRRAAREAARAGKATDTPLSKWKRRHFEAQTGIPVEVIRT